MDSVWSRLGYIIRWLRREGRDRLPTLSEIMGHSSVKQTEQYLAYVSPEGAQKGAQRQWFHAKTSAIKGLLRH